ncbi:hypothetical protein [Fusobacterium polymorphum]|uniref:Uncharacterized protein n=1 Tax=Fusobacterium nucleatum subsp. polymorphum TaxID=76857 RepID=A0A2C6A4J7_FUSNP|nr:hypothetical protein [Fusobacterium polymorphum]PHI06630.1 hypothetical protein CBG54_06070 [Fusobacterium polymorphum]
MKDIKDNFKIDNKKLEIHREKINKDTFFIGYYKNKYTCVGIMENKKYGNNFSYIKKISFVDIKDSNKKVILNEEEIKEVCKKFKIENYDIYNEKTPMLNLEILYIEEIRNIN